MPTLNLRPYQQEAVTAMLRPPRDVWRQLIVLGTGGGKTVCFANYFDQLLRPGERALLLAHREELLQQAADKISWVAPSLSVEFEQADRYASRHDGFFDDQRRTVVLASVQSLHDQRLKTWARDAFRTIVVDECHRGTAATYQAVFEWFGCMDDEKKTPLIGVTATPGRSDGVGMGNVFQHIGCNYGMSELIEIGFLAPIVAHRISSSVDLRAVSVARGDYAQGELENAVDETGRNSLIVAAYRAFGNGAKTIAFCAGVAHSVHLASVFCAVGIPAEPVYGAMDRDERKKTYQRFRDGETRILTNFGLLVEGYDEPEVACIILARPTKSSLVLCQAIGRGTRLHPGKEECVVIDVQDVTSRASCVSAATLAGLPAEFNPQGRSIFALGKKFAEAPASERWRIKDATQLQELIERKKNGIASETVDLFSRAQIHPVVATHSQLHWTRLHDSLFRISFREDDWVSTYVLRMDALGTVHFEGRRSKKDSSTEYGVYSSFTDAFREADFIISRFHDTRNARISGGWREKKPTQVQLKALQELGVDYPPKITRGEAQRLINLGTRVLSR